MSQQHQITAELLWRLSLVWIGSRQGLCEPNNSENQPYHLLIGLEKNPLNNVRSRLRILDMDREYKKPAILLSAGQAGGC